MTEQEHKEQGVGRQATGLPPAAVMIPWNVSKHARYRNNGLYESELTACITEQSYTNCNGYLSSVENLCKVNRKRIVS